MIPIIDIKILIAMILLSPYLFTCSVIFQGADPAPQHNESNLGQYDNPRS